MIPVDLIIERGHVLTMDPRHRLIDDGAVAVSGQTIVAVGTTSAVRAAYTAPTVIDAHHKVVMPGLIDTYGHAGHGMVKGIWRPDVPWPSYDLYFNKVTERWWYAEGLLSALERLRFGVTTGFTVVGATPARMDSPVFAERQAQAVKEVGVREVLGVGPPDPHVSHVPTPWTATVWEGDTPVSRPFTYRETVDHTVHVIKTWHGQADQRVHVAIHFPYLFGRQAQHRRFPFIYTEEHVPIMIEQAEEMRALADLYDVLLHTHAFRGSLDFGLTHFGPDRVQRLLAGGTVLAHCNGLGESEVEALGQAGAGIAVVPYTHENLWYGPCPAVALLRAGANVTIATDGTYPYCSYDLLKDVPRAIWTQWGLLEDQTVLPPGKALRMVTIDAAAALKLDHLVGSLEIGKRADIILVDLNRPHLVPSDHIPRLLTFYANGNDVDTVIVNGQVLMQGRRVLSVDEDAILDLAREEAAKAFERFDLEPYLAMDDAFWNGPTY